MANPILPIQGTHELQERYTTEVVALKRKQNLVRNFFNRNFMGDPKAGAVQFIKRPLEVALTNYNVQNGTALTFGSTEYMQVLVDNNVALNELIDGYEAAAVPDNIVAQRIESGAFEMGRRQELDAIATLVAGGTAETVDTATATNDVYAAIVQSISEVKKTGIPKESLVVIISDETEVKLLTDDKFADTASTVGAELIREGVVGRIAGVPVIVSSNIKDVAAGDDLEIEWIVFSTLYAATAEEWIIEPTIRDLMDGAHIGASALQGRMVYKDAVLDAAGVRVKTVDVA